MLLLAALLLAPALAFSPGPAMSRGAPLRALYGPPRPVQIIPS
ncbi:hypothetical protein TeGR_g12057, partial [Tetraparma gracilis]